MRRRKWELGFWLWWGHGNRRTHQTTYKYFCPGSTRVGRLGSSWKSIGPMDCETQDFKEQSKRHPRCWGGGNLKSCRWMDKTLSAGLGETLRYTGNKTITWIQLVLHISGLQNWPCNQWIGWKIFEERIWLNIYRFSFLSLYPKIQFNNYFYTFMWYLVFYII